LYVTKLTPAEGVEPAELLSVAAAAEQMSRHPVARALLEVTKEAGLTLPAVDNFKETPGRGVTALVDSAKIVLGRDSFLRENNVDITTVTASGLHEEHGFRKDESVMVFMTIGNHGGILGHEFSPGGYRALQKSGHGGIARRLGVRASPVLITGWNTCSRSCSRLRRVVLP
jgi:cation transport ATPase